MCWYEVGKWIVMTYILSIVTQCYSTRDFNEKNGLCFANALCGIVIMDVDLYTHINIYAHNKTVAELNLYI